MSERDARVPNMELIRQARGGDEEEEVGVHPASTAFTPANREKSDEQMEENGCTDIEHGVRCGQTRSKLFADERISSSSVPFASHAHHEGSQSARNAPSQRAETFLCRFTVVHPAHFM